MAEAATGKSYKQLLRSEIYRPVGLATRACPTRWRCRAATCTATTATSRACSRTRASTSTRRSPGHRAGSSRRRSTSTASSGPTSAAISSAEDRPRQDAYRPRPLLASRPGTERRDARAVPLPDPLRDRLGPHRLLPRLPPVRRLERQRPPLGRLLGQLADRSRPGLAARLGADPQGAGRRGLPGAALSVRRGSEPRDAFPISLDKTPPLAAVRSAPLPAAPAARGRPVAAAGGARLGAADGGRDDARDRRPRRGRRRSMGSVPGGNGGAAGRRPRPRRRHARADAASQPTTGSLPATAGRLRR